MSKELLSSEQTEVLADKDTDCGSKRFIHITMTKSNYRDFMYRYIKDGDELIMLNTNNIEKYIGKKVQMRSPMYCIGIGKEKQLCNKCAGDFYYKLGKRNIGLFCSSISGTLSNLNLQKFHDNVVHTKQLDVDNLLL